MIRPRDRAIVSKLARQYGASRVWLFGSSVHGRGRDLDLAVEGLLPARFFPLLGELMLQLSRPVDLVAVDRPSKLRTLIRRDGVPIYGDPARED